MKLKHLLTFALFLFSVLSFAQNKDQKAWDSITGPKGWINDYEDIYTDKQELELRQMISAYEKKTGVQFIIVTVPSAAKLDALNLTIATNWGANKKGQDNAILIAISKIVHRIRIQNGINIKTRLSDKDTKEIINSFIIPGFKNNEYYQATVDGINQIIKALEKAPPK